MTSGIFFFVGPVLLVFAMVFEWIMGNFFPMMVMGLFSVFWLSFGLLQLPTLGLATPYATAADKTGLGSPEYNAVVGLYLIVWGFALFTFFIFTLKINAVFAGIFGGVTVAAWVLAGAYFKVASGDFTMAGRLQKVRRIKGRRCWKILTYLQGWRGITVRCCSTWMVHVLYNHGGRDAFVPEAASRRPQSFLAQDRR